MGNCCAAQKTPLKGFDESKRPLRPPISAASDQGTRPSTPGTAYDNDEDLKKHNQGGAKGYDESPSRIGDRRKNNLNQLEALAPREPPSQVNSVQSSTIPGDGASMNSNLGINTKHLGSSPGMNLPRVSRTNENPSNHLRKSVISHVSEFKQDSVDLDEQVPNAQEALSHIRKNKNDYLMFGKSGLNRNPSQKKISNKLDLSIPTLPRKQIYQITSEFPVMRPYSTSQEWQKILHKYSLQQQQMVDDKPVDTAYDDLAESLLAQPNRNWIRDQLKMHQENRLAMQDSFSNLVKQRQALQLKEHFTWFVWSVGQYYFGAPDRSQQSTGDTTRDNNDPELFHSRATIVDQDVSGFDEQDASFSNISRGNTTTKQSQAQQPQQTTQPTRQTVFTCKLPKTNSSKWSEGFSFKGVFFRILPYEDAEHILEEVKALKYIQTELLDLQAQEQAFMQQQSDLNSSPGHRQNPLKASFSEGHLHKDVILPFLVGVKCCGFYLYGTPLIYTQEMQTEQRDSFRMSAHNGSEVLGGLGSGSIVNIESESHVLDSENFTLPRFSSVNPLEAGGNYAANIEKLRRGSFGYLHENIDDDTMKDPILQRMPLMKNISRRNLIPVIDFEEFNRGSSNIYASGLSNNSGRPVNIQVNYLMVYLASTLRTLSSESTSSVLFTLPSSASDEIAFHPYPSDCLVDCQDLEKMLTQQAAQGLSGNVSTKPLGDREEQKSQSKNMQNSGPNALNRKFLTKHGWHSFMIERKQANPTTSNVSSQQYASRGVENKRASIFFNLRENSAGGLEGFLETKESTMPIIQERNEGQTPSKQHRVQQTPKSSNPFSAYKNVGGLENLESTPRVTLGIAPGLHATATRASQSIFVSPLKKTVMKRSEQNRDEMVYGNVVVSAVYTKGFKILYSMTQHTYANGIDTMFQLSLDQVAKIMETSDRVLNIDTLKSLMHRKGLNLRFLWVLLTKVKLKQSRDLIMVAILVRTMRRIINEEVKIGSATQKPISSIPFVQTSNQMASFFRRSSHQKSNKESQQPYQQNFRASAMNNCDNEYYQGNRSQLYRECITLFSNAVMKNKFAKYKQVFDETLLGLFLSRLRIITLAHSLELSQTQLNYLESKDIMDHVLEMPSQNPIMFLNSVESYFQIEFKQEFTRRFRQDKYFILNKPQPIGRSDITKINHRVVTYFSLREHAYFILARKIASHAQRSKAARKNNQNVRESNASLARMFQRPRKDGRGNPVDTSMQSFTDQNQTDRQHIGDETPRNQLSNPSMNNYTMRQKSNANSKTNNDTYRNFKNLQSSHVSMQSTSNYQNIIDLSKTKRGAFKPQKSGEILLPSCFYKMHTSTNTEASASNMQDLIASSGSSVFQPYYDMPNVDVINEWVIVLESLLNEVYSVQGCEAVLLEALTHQCIMTLFLEQDADGSIKVLQKVRELLFSALTCPPEIVVLCMMLTGVWQDLNEEMDQFPIESEKNYLSALTIAFQIFGDPRGRGNYSIPYYLFFAWKLSLLAQAEGKKTNDMELCEELFDATLSSLFNHKRMFKSNQLELVAAQEQAHSSVNFQHNASNGNMPTINNMNSSTFIRQGALLQFELTVDHQDVMNNQFDMQKYRRRPQNVVTAGGFVKSTQQINFGLASAKKSNTNNDSYAFSSMTKGHQPQHLRSVSKATDGIMASMHGHGTQSMNYLQKSNYDAEISDIDIEFKIDDDEDRQRLAQLNFRESETLVGKVPFPHWTIIRPIMQSQANVLSGEKPQDAKEMRKEMIRDQLTKQVDLEALFPWIVNYNPAMSPSGIQWNSKKIKEVVFCQNSQIVGSSEPSSVTFSSHKMSQYSYRSNSERNATRRKVYLNPYSSYLGKEVGGSQKGEVLGQLYSWGTDQYGQLGIEYFITNKHQGAMQSLKMMHPRLLMPLKDELIKEITCGHAHTLAINQFGQMYSWGHNDSGQLGLGDGVPDIVRKPVLNSSINNVSKLAAGHEHSLALTKTLELYVWGAGTLTGLGVNEDVCTPTLLDLQSKAKSKKVLTSDVNKISQIACGGLHTAVVIQNGELYTWGSSEGGQLGHISTEDLSQELVKQPTRVEYLAEKSLCVSSVSCGEAHTVVLTSDDQVWGWGMSMYGQLGLGFSGDSFEPGEGMSKSKVTVPTEITQYMPPEITVAKIICGAAFTMFLTTEHELYGCGINDLGQLGLDTYLEEMQMAVIDRARQAAGGIRDVVTSDVTVPSRVICFEGLKVNTVCCGESHSLALIGEEKSLWAWGMYRNGQLGLGEVSQKMNPRPVQSLHTTNVHKLAAGSQHSLALLGDSNQLTALAANFFLNSDLLQNPWAIDYRKLANEEASVSRDVSIAYRPKY